MSQSHGVREGQHGGFVQKPALHVFAADKRGPRQRREPGLWKTTSRGDRLLLPTRPEGWPISMGYVMTGCWVGSYDRFLRWRVLILVQPLVALFPGVDLFKGGGKM